MSGLEIRELRKSFASGDVSLEVLRGVDLTLAPGDAAAIMGPSGSGKSTLLHLIGALDRPSSGSLRIDGQDPLELDEQALARFRNRVAGFVFQADPRLSRERARLRIVGTKASRPRRSH
jgi:ABC-type lipoprotein export system ATPase subunit